MKKLLLIIIFLFTLTVTPSVAFAQGMMGNWTSSSSSAASDDHTVKEEVEGKEVWEKLQAKQLECKDLTNENHAALGEYFMGQRAGDSHESMNKMMEQMMGKESEEQMHVAIGKKLSGCGSNAATKGGGNYMMGYGGWGGFGLGWLFMLLFWALLILGVAALIRSLIRSGDNKQGKTSLDILKERYAGGEIDKKEFEEKKKDLS